MTTFASSADLSSRYKTRFTIATTTSTSTSAEFKREITQVIIFSQGHFAPEAADFVNKNLLKVLAKSIQQTPLESLTNIIKHAFKYIQVVMLNHWKNHWQKSDNGHNSLAGTSTTLILVTNDGILFTGNVGGTVLYLVPIDQLSKEASAIKLTNEHVISNPKEMQNLFLQHGSSVMEYLAPKLETDESADSGECCIIWDKSKCMCQPEVCNSCGNSVVPMTPLTRTLGDFWNLRSDLKTRIISNDPDVQEFKLDENGANNYLVFLSRNLSKYIDEELVKTAVSLNEDGTLQDPAKEIITAAILQLRREQNISKFENMSVLVVPISKISETSVGRLTQTMIGENSIFCIDQDDTQYSSVMSSMEEFYLEHLKSEISDPSSTKKVETVSLIVSSNDVGNNGMTRKKAKIKFNLKRNLFEYIRWNLSRKIFRKYLRLIRQKNYPSCDSRDDPGNCLELERYSSSYPNAENVRIPELESNVAGSEDPPVSVNIIQWRKCVNFSFPPSPLTPSHSNQDGIQNPERQVTPLLSLDLNSLLSKNIYILFCNKSCHVLVQFPANEVVLPETVKFFPLPATGRNDMDTGYSFHISENVAGRLEMLQGVKSQVLGVYEGIVRSLGGSSNSEGGESITPATVAACKEEEILERNVKTEIKQETTIKNDDTLCLMNDRSNEQGHSETFSEKTLLFSVPIQNESQLVHDNSLLEDDRTIKVFLLSNSDSASKPLSQTESVSTALVPYKPKEDKCLQTDLIFPYSWSSSQRQLPAILPSMPSANSDNEKKPASSQGPAEKRKPLSSCIIRNDEPPLKRPRTNPEKEVVTPTPGGNPQQLKKNVSSCAFLARGCGGKCIIPKTSSKTADTAKSEAQTEKKNEDVASKSEEDKKTVEVKAVVSQVEGEQHIVLHIPEYSKTVDVNDDFLRGIVPNILGDSDTRGKSENEPSNGFDLFKEMELVAWGNQHGGHGGENVSKETAGVSSGCVNKPPKFIDEDDFLNDDYPSQRMHSNNSDRKLGQDKCIDSKTTRPQGLFSSLTALQKRLDSIVKPELEAKSVSTVNSLHNDKKGDAIKDAPELSENKSLPTAESQICTKHDENLDLLHSSAKVDLQRADKAYCEKLEPSLDRKQYKKRNIYQVCGGQRIRINAESIKKETGKEPEACFKELKPKFQNVESVPVYDLD